MTLARDAPRVCSSSRTPSTMLRAIESSCIWQASHTLHLDITSQIATKVDERVQGGSNAAPFNDFASHDNSPLPLGSDGFAARNQISDDPDRFADRGLYWRTQSKGALLIGLNIPRLTADDQNACRPTTERSHQL